MRNYEMEIVRLDTKTIVYRVKHAHEYLRGKSYTTEDGIKISSSSMPELAIGQLMIIGTERSMDKVWKLKMWPTKEQCDQCLDSTKKAIKYLNALELENLNNVEPILLERVSCE